MDSTKRLILAATFASLALPLIGLCIARHFRTAAAAPVAVSDTVAACEENGNARNAFNIVDTGHAYHHALYSMKDGALNDSIGRDGRLAKQTIIGVTEPRFPGDPPLKLSVDLGARTCSLPGYVYALK